MTSLHHTTTEIWPVAATGIMVLASVWHARDWYQMRRTLGAVPAWRAASFVLGVSLVWGALGSPIAAYDHALLTFHMIQHLLLMTFAPGLILLGEPLLVFWSGL